MRSERFAFLARRLTGYLWLLVWMALLYVVASPWRQLGGVVDERLRWLEWCVLTVGLAVGFTAGRFARDAAAARPGRSHLDLARYLLYPFAGLTALTLLALTALGKRDPVGVVVTAFLAYWAGTDIAFGAVPLMEGKAYGPTRPVDPDPAPAPRRPWMPPWERY